MEWRRSNLSMPRPDVYHHAGRQMSQDGPQTKAFSGAFAIAISTLMSSLEIFLRKNGLLIACIRFAVAIILAVLGLTDPHRLGFAPELDDLLYLFYLGWTAGLLILCVISWEWAYTSVPFALLIDLCLFILIPHSELPRPSDVLVGTSVLGSLMVLQVGLHWSVRQALTAAIGINLICMLNCAVGVGMHHHAMDLYIRQIVILAIASLFAVWASYRIAPPKLPLLQFDGVGITRSSLDRILRFAMEAMSSRKGFLVWKQGDDPESAVLDTSCNWDGTRISTDALSPLLENERSARRGVMVGPVKGLLICSNGLGRVERAALDRRLRLIIGCQKPQTLFVGSVCAGNSQGIVVLGDVALPASEDVLLFESLTSSLNRIFEKMTQADAEMNTAIHETRESIARDLHDSVAQSLAGAKFHLAAILKGDLPADVSVKIAKLKTAIDDEHAAIRDYIDHLRLRDEQVGSSGPITEIVSLCRRLEATWNVTVELDASADFGTLDQEQLLEIQQIIREAVANSVRHGGASLVRIECSGNDLGLQLTISDNGNGMSPEHVLTPPKSIKERIATLRGNLKVISKATGVKLFMFIPVRAKN